MKKLKFRFKIVSKLVFEECNVDKSGVVTCRDDLDF